MPTPAPRAARGAVAALVVALGAVSCGSGSAEPAALDPQTVEDGALTVCTDMPYEPFEFDKDGVPTGFDIDLVNQVAKRLQVEPTIVDTDFDAIQSGDSLNSGACDVAISAMTITGDRARVVDFSSPYFDASQALVVEKGTGLASLDDLGGRRIGVQGGTTGEIYVTDNAPGDAEIVPFEDSAAMDTAMRKGEVDAAVYDNTVVGDVVGANPDLSVAAEFDTGEQYGMAVKKNGSVDLLRTINDVLATMKKDGGYDATYTKWFGSAKNTQNEG